MDKALACRLIRASHLAYDIAYNQPLSNQPQNVQQEIAAIGYDPATFKFKELGIDACHYGETTDGKAVLAFRGTLPPSLGIQDPAKFLTVLSDWLNDGEIRLVKGRQLPGRVHKGFLDSLDALWPIIRGFGLDNSKPLYITGHSKGGGLTYLAAYRIKEEFHIQPVAYTFAAPRVGDAPFAEDFDREITEAWRFEYRDDLVPHLPPRTAAWSKLLPGLRAVEGKFPLETLQVKLAPNVASDFEKLLGQLQQRAASVDFNYVSAGKLQFINWENPPSIQPESKALSMEREWSLAKKLAVFKLAEIIQDHSSDGGYMACPCSALPVG
jgi:hypothetical protein